MNRILIMIVCLTMLVDGIANAQQPPLPAARSKTTRPLLFSSLPDVFEVERQALQGIFAMPLNDAVNVQLSSHFVVAGILVDKIQHTPGSLTVNVKLENYANALFNMTLQLQADNSTRIQGRIIHPKFGDALILYKEQDKYYFKKKSLALLIPD